MLVRIDDYLLPLLIAILTTFPNKYFSKFLFPFFPVFSDFFENFCGCRRGGPGTASNRPGG